MAGVLSAVERAAGRSLHGMQFSLICHLAVSALQRYLSSSQELFRVVFQKNHKLLLKQYMFISGQRGLQVQQRLSRPMGPRT